MDLEQTTHVCVVFRQASSPQCQLSTLKDSNGQALWREEGSELGKTDSFLPCQTQILEHETAL